MPDIDNKILKHNHGEKSSKALAIIYAGLECLLEKTHSCQNNLEKYYKKNAYALVNHCLQVVHLMQRKTDCYKGEDCMERFCKDVREHAMKITDYEKKK